MKVFIIIPIILVSTAIFMAGYATALAFLSKEKHRLTVEIDEKNRELLWLKREILKCKFKLSVLNN